MRSRRPCGMPLRCVRVPSCSPLVPLRAASSRVTAGLGGGSRLRAFACGSRRTDRDRRAARALSVCGAQPPSPRSALCARAAQTRGRTQPSARDGANGANTLRTVSLVEKARTSGCRAFCAGECLWEDGRRRGAGGQSVYGPASAHDGTAACRRVCRRGVGGHVPRPRALRGGGDGSGRR
jgi:hypothetical protein